MPIPILKKGKRKRDRVKKEVHWEDEAKSRCSSSEVYDNKRKMCVPEVGPEQPSILRWRLEDRQHEKWSHERTRKKLKEELGKVLSKHNRSCTFHGKEYNCLANGCMWQRGGRFPNGKCVGPLLDKIRLSDPPKAGDIERLDDLLRFMEKTDKSLRPIEMEVQLRFLLALKQTLTSEIAWYNTIRDRVRALNASIAQKKSEIDLLGATGSAKLETELHKVRVRRDFIAQRVTNTIWNGGSYMAALGIAALGHAPRRMQGGYHTLAGHVEKWNHRRVETITDLLAGV